MTRYIVVRRLKTIREPDDTDRYATVIPLVVTLDSSKGTVHGVKDKNYADRMAIEFNLAYGRMYTYTVEPYDPNTDSTYFYCPILD